MLRLVRGIIQCLSLRKMATSCGAGSSSLQLSHAVVVELWYWEAMAIAPRIPAQSWRVEATPRRT